MLVADVESRHGLADFEMFKQIARSACVLSEDAIHLLQDADGTQGDVLQIADWRRHKVEFRHGRQDSNLRETKSLSF